MELPIEDLVVLRLARGCGTIVSSGVWPQTLLQV